MLSALAPSPYERRCPMLLWTRLCFFCRRLLTRPRPDQPLTCASCGWIWH